MIFSCETLKISSFHLQTFSAGPELVDNWQLMGTCAGLITMGTFLPLSPHCPPDPTLATQLPHPRSCLGSGDMLEHQASLENLSRRELPLILIQSPVSRFKQSYQISHSLSKSPRVSTHSLLVISLHSSLNVMT